MNCSTNLNTSDGLVLRYIPVVSQELRCKRSTIKVTRGMIVTRLRQKGFEVKARPKQNGFEAKAGPRQNGFEAEARPRQKGFEAEA